MSKPAKGRLKRSSLIHHSGMRDNSLTAESHASTHPHPCSCPLLGSSQPSSHASQVSKEKQPSQTLREDPLPWSTVVSATQSSGHRSTLMNLPLKLPGMEVGGFTSGMEVGEGGGDYIKYCGGSWQARHELQSRSYSTEHSSN